MSPGSHFSRRKMAGNNEGETSAAAAHFRVCTSDPKQQPEPRALVFAVRSAQCPLWLLQAAHKLIQNAQSRLPGGWG